MRGMNGMQITDQARDQLVKLLKDKHAVGIRLYFGGYG